MSRGLLQIMRNLIIDRMYLYSASIRFIMLENHILLLETKIRKQTKILATIFDLNSDWDNVFKKHQEDFRFMNTIKNLKNTFSIIF